MSRHAPNPNEPRYAYKTTTTEKLLGNLITGTILTYALITLGMILAPSIATLTLIGAVIMTSAGGFAGLLLLIIPATLKDLHII